MTVPERCPDCGCTRIEFEAGYPQTYDEPGQPDAWYCVECGAAMEVDPIDVADTRGEARYEEERQRQADGLDSILDD